MAETQSKLPVALVTGGARRIGREIALGLARAGWSIAIHHRGSGSDAESLLQEITALGRRAATFEGDLADAACATSLVTRCLETIGAPICLINNASLFEYDEIRTLSADGLQRHLAVNVTAPILLAQSFALHLPAGKLGNIINIIDQRVWAPTPEFFSYSLSKSALWAATKMLAQGLSPRIRVNAVGPGPTLPSVHQKPGDFEAEAASTPLHRGTMPEEIAAAVRFILDAPSMTGQMIALDGGQHLRWFPEVTSGAAKAPR